MKRFYFLVILFAICVLSVSANAKDSYAYLLEGEAPNLDSAIYPERKLDAPHPGLVAVSKLYQTDGRFPPDKVARRTLFLKAFFLNYSQQYARASIHALKGQGISLVFFEDVDVVRKWFVSLIAQTPDEIREAAKYEEDKFTWVLIVHQAFVQEHAGVDLAERTSLLEGLPERLKLENHFKHTFHYAQRGYLPAITEMANAYKESGNLPENALKHYFWLRHASWAGVNMEEEIKKMITKLSVQSVNEMDELFDTNKYPDVMEKNNARWKPISGPNRRWVPPYLGRK